MGKRAEQILKQRENILDASLRLFVQKSYQGTTVRDIAAEAQVSVGLLFHYFPTKEDMLKELILQSEEGTRAVLRLLSSKEKPVVIFEQIAKMVFETYKVEKYLYLYLLVNQVVTFDAIPAEIKYKGNYNKTILASVPVIKRGQRGKSVKAGSAESLSLAFWGAIQGIAELLFWFPDFKIPDYNIVVDILRK